MSSNLSRIAASLLCCCLLNSLASAKNIDLVTVPARESVQLTIYNSEDLTLVRETRFVTLKKGSNRLQFSWAGTLIDPTSIELTPLGHANEVDILDTVLPGQKPQHLIWNIESEIEGQVPVEVRYFTSGLTWQMDYVGITDENEETIDFRGHVRVFNRSGEEYENAEIRMIVGTINLVHKLEDLVRKDGEKLDKSRLERFKATRKQDLMMKLREVVVDQKAMSAEIVKEGVSEYFMFSVDGQETVPNGWSKRMPAAQAPDTKFDIVYRVRRHQYGARPVRFFVWKNTEEFGLGDSPLPNGKVRIFRSNGRDGLTFLGQQDVNYVPIGAPIEINLGTDDLVVYEQRRDQVERLNFQFRHTPRIVVGWDERQDWSDTLRNYRAKPIKVEVRHRFSGDVEIQSEDPLVSFDFRTVEAKFQLNPGQSLEFKYQTSTHRDANGKQERVRIVR